MDASDDRSERPARPRAAAPGKREYVKPAVLLRRDIEAITGICEAGGQNTMQEKMSFDPATGMCMNPMT